MLNTIIKISAIPTGILSSILIIKSLDTEVERKGIMDTLDIIPTSFWAILLIVSIILFLWSNRKPTKILFRPCSENGRFQNAMDEYETDINAIKLCDRLHKLGISCPIPDGRNWNEFVDTMKVYAEDKQIEKAKNYEFVGLVWEPPD